VGLAELLAAFSLATDLGLGQPMEHVLRSWRIAARLAERVGLADDERIALYYIAVLAWVGCVANTPEVAAWFGDDIASAATATRRSWRGSRAWASCWGTPAPGVRRSTGSASPRRWSLPGARAFSGG
jgi:hypothetical protein